MGSYGGYGKKGSYMIAPRPIVVSDELAEPLIEGLLL